MTRYEWFHLGSVISKYPPFTRVHASGLLRINLQYQESVFVKTIGIILQLTYNPLLHENLSVVSFIEKLLLAGELSDISVIEHVHCHDDQATVHLLSKVFNIVIEFQSILEAQSHFKYA